MAVEEDAHYLAAALATAFLVLHFSVVGTLCLLFGVSGGVVVVLWCIVERWCSHIPV